MQSNAGIARKCPWRCGPYDHIRILQLPPWCCTLFDLEGHVYRRGSVIIVLHLCVCQGCDTVVAPVDRFQSFVYMALLRHLAEYLDLFCLVMGMEGNVGLIPVAPDAEPLELLGHSFDVLGGKLFASPAKLNWAERFTLEFVRFDDLGFYREAVGIPAWYVGHVVAHHSFVLNDKVFHHLVVGCADVYLSVGVWRAIMKDEDRTALPLLCDLSYIFCSSHRLSISGSFLDRPALIGKDVWGRYSVWS